MNVELIDHMGSDLTIVNSARVSFNKVSKAVNDNDEKLIRYLARHGHWSPFAHAFMQFRIKAPIFVARQLVKHQVGLSWNEVSRRYVDEPPEFHSPSVWRGRPENTKQGSDGEVEDQNTPQKVLEQTNLLAFKNYNALIKQGVSPEQARMILPQTMMTEWWWSGSLHAFARVCNQRLDHHSQEETQVIARAIQDHAINYFPVSWMALSGT
jgi:thymidylate synthase (FAD)|tara:strand:+ start:2875 stop:3504 length:630 start_codon:yes stop_codon:yes gene_type:complete